MTLAHHKPLVLVTPPVSFLVSHSTSAVHTCTQVDHMVLLHTAIDDLVEINKVLENVNEWLLLGLQLGLIYPTLKRIEEEQDKNIKKCKTEMLAAWLQEEDNVADPCCADLKAALKNIGQNRVASEINP